LSLLIIIITNYEGRKKTTHRVTVVINAENMIKLRNKQAAQIKTSPKSISFSNILNQTLTKGLK